MELYTDQLQEIEYSTRKSITKAHKKGEKTKVKIYCTDILTFDIEVTSGWIKDGEVIGYHKGETNEFWNDLQPVALCYIWQFSFNDKVYYGRELKDFMKVLEDLPSEYKFIIWVHNLSYEFQFLCNILHWKTVFARSPRKPMKAQPKEFQNIEFRCSYMLTRLSLDSWGKQLGVLKHTGDLDYEKIRTPKTKLTAKEMGYCEYDCLVVYAGIKSYLKRYKDVFDIPLTQTGTVRREVKNRLTSNPDYVKKIKKLVPATTEEYKMLMQVFAGGYTHANRYYSGMVVDDTVEHFDFTSSYPTCMIAFKYPMSIWHYIGCGYIPKDELFEDNAFIMKLQFNQLNCMTCNTYLQASKCEGKGFMFDNGRVISAEQVTITITEQDWLTIRETYTWESMEVLELYQADKAYLPKDFTEYILELYKNKTNYKDVDGMEDIYLQSKQYINSMFGMCVTAIVQANVNFDGNGWSVSQLTEEEVQKHLDKLRMWYPSEKRYFLNYSWGCWVTAYARRNLWKCIESCDEDMIYCDTDSIFVEGGYNFDWYNDWITEKLRTACKEQGLDFEKTRPKTPKGKAKPLGIFDREDNCEQFITLGAKRYVERRESDHKLHLTVSGINKEAVDLLEDDIDNFADGFNFDKDAPSVHKQLATYIDNQPEVVFPDGYKSNYTHGINLRRTGYLLTMTDEYKKLIEYDNIDTGALGDTFFNKLRSYF